MNTGNFTFEVLVTFVLPGFLVAVAVLLMHGVDNAGMTMLMQKAAEAQFLSVFMILAVIVLCGALVASVHAVVGTLVLDRITARRVSQTKADFDRMWMEYVEALPNLKNPYISRVVLFFQFESRLGLALLFLGAGVFSASKVHGWAFLSLGLFVYLIGAMHHKELAEHRKQICAKLQTASKGAAID
jgi:hypothetical protein